MFVKPFELKLKVSTSITYFDYVSFTIHCGGVQRQPYKSCTKATVCHLKTPCVMSGRYEKMDTAQAWCLVLTFFRFIKQALMKQREKANVKNVFTSRFKRQKKFPTLVSVRSNVVCSPWSKAACIGSVYLCVCVSRLQSKKRRKKSLTKMHKSPDFIFVVFLEWHEQIPAWCRNLWLFHKP